MAQGSRPQGDADLRNASYTRKAKCHGYPKENRRCSDGRHLNRTRVSIMAGNEICLEKLNNSPKPHSVILLHSSHQPTDRSFHLKVQAPPTYRSFLDSELLEDMSYLPWPCFPIIQNKAWYKVSRSAGTEASCLENALKIMALSKLWEFTICVTSRWKLPVRSLVMYTGPPAEMTSAARGSQMSVSTGR
ncbi:uncharacterized protein LOC143675553 [Tamandua tetradactyla]|uniref:uncharacterized protein LOC143675553 n=1 Tax=Tamandua tetradactyla TaxID=48850 RepID=UPI004054919B